MRKKILNISICAVMAAVLCVAMTGCALFEHNYEKDYSREVVKIAAVHDTYNVEDDNGNVVKTLTFRSEEKTILKSQLVNLWNNNASSLVPSLGAEGAAEYLLDQLVQRELILIEARRMKEFGLMPWNQRDKNVVTQSVYSSIDSLLGSLINAVLDDRDLPTIEAGSDDDSETSTTYPTPSVEEPEVDEDPVKWTPDLNSYPAISADPAVNSRDREAVRRLVSQLESYVKDDISATEQEKKWFERDLKKLRGMISASREQDIYPMLYDADYDPAKDDGTGTYNDGKGTYIVHYLWGQNAEENRLIARMEETIKDAVTVSDAEIEERYNVMLGTQRASYQNSSTYHTAMTSTTENVIYNPNSNYFYVKHILLPFTEEQKADIESYGNTHTKAQKIAYREQLSKEIVAYPHVDGEDDLTRPMSVGSIFSAVTSQMSRYRYNAREAERLFDSLIYEYGTDPGSFGNTNGYAVRYKLPDGEKETYMEEFAAAARTMYDELEVGQVYGKPVVTDFGVHIMYFASKTQAGGEKKLNDYQTNAEYKTVREVIEETLRSSKETSAYNEFLNKTISRYEEMTDENNNSIITKYSSRYKDLYS